MAGQPASAGPHVAGVSPVSHAEEPIVRLRHPGRWVAAVVLVVLAAMFVNFVVTTRQLRLDLVVGYLFERSILRGLLLTVELTAIAMLIGVVLGTVLAIMRLSENPILRGVAGGYVWLFRGTPILVQLLFWFFLGTVLPQISLGVPFGPAFVTVSSNTLITQFVAAILGLGLNEAAYMAEIVRAGIGSVDRGQTEAAEALSMSPGLTYRRIILPQAARVIVPPTANELVSMLKLTSLCLVIGLPELLTTAQLIYGRNFQQIPLLIVASIWYIVLTTILTVVQARIERRMSRGVLGAATRRSRLAIGGR
jgi:polar amino acid transport system permease protein